MNREVVGRDVVGLYPWRTRYERGNELVGTLLEAGEESPLAFARQALSAARCGLLGRAASELRRPVAQIATSALCWVAVMNVVSVPVGKAGQQLHSSAAIAGPHTFMLLYIYLLPLLILVMIATYLERAAGIVGLAWLGCWIGLETGFAGGLPASYVLEVVVPPALGFALLAARPADAISVGRSLWIVIAAVWFVCSLTGFGLGLGLGGVMPVIAALVLLPWAPSLALGTAIAWSLPAGIVLLHTAGRSSVSSVPWMVEAFGGIPLAIVVVWMARRATAPSQ